MLGGGFRSVIVGNHARELEHLRGRENVYFATGSDAAGILEGMRYHRFGGMSPPLPSKSSVTIQTGLEPYGDACQACGSPHSTPHGSPYIRPRDISEDDGLLALGADPNASKARVKQLVDILATQQQQQQQQQQGSQEPRAAPSAP